MGWLILINVIAWGLCYLLITSDDKLEKWLFGILIVGILVYCIWARPDFIYSNLTRTIIVNVICDVIGFIILYPKLTENK